LLTALRVLEIVRQRRQDLDELTAEMVIYPQVLLNVRVRERKPLDQLERVCAEVRRTEAEFGEAGRVVVRFSGTEPLARVMVEGPALGRVEFNARAIAEAIRGEIGE
jgi:phosphoglucosamine mutase